MVRLGFIGICLASLVGCMGTKPEQPVQNKLPQQAVEAGFTIPDKSRNYCYVWVDGKKTWSSFIWRDGVLKVSPRNRSRRVAYFTQVRGALWKNRDGSETYEFYDGGALWRSNDASGLMISFKQC
jgi:hypothetical protein